MWKILVSEVSLDVLQVIMFLDFAFTLRGPCPSTFMQLPVSAVIWRWKVAVVEKREATPQHTLLLPVWLLCLTFVDIIMMLFCIRNVWSGRAANTADHYLIIYSNNSPPGKLLSLRLQPSVGYRWIRLDPQGPKISRASPISGPDHCGRRRQVPGEPEPGQHQGLNFGQSC